MTFVTLYSFQAVTWCPARCYYSEMAQMTMLDDNVEWMDFAFYWYVTEKKISSYSGTRKFVIKGIILI